MKGVKMKIKDLIDLYEKKRKLYGNDTYKHTSELLSEAKQIHHQDVKKSNAK